MADNTAVLLAVLAVAAMVLLLAMMATIMAKDLNTAGLSATVEKLAVFDKDAILDTAQAQAMALAKVLAT